MNELSRRDIEINEPGENKLALVSQVSVEELLQSELDKMEQEQEVNQDKEAAEEQKMNDELRVTLEFYQNKLKESQKKSLRNEKKTQDANLEASD